LKNPHICYDVRQEHLFDIEATCNCGKDEGGPFGAGLQEQASNHLKLLWSRARVVSVKEKSWHRIMAGRDQGGEQQRTTDEASKR
jgi:hypothetical protein